MPPSPIQVPLLDSLTDPGSPESTTESTADSSTSKDTLKDVEDDKDEDAKDKGQDKGKSKEREVTPQPPVHKPEPITFDPLPKQSIRTALILDRFSLSCPIIYCSNDSFLSTTRIMGRSFFDFVIKKDEELVRSWIDAVKGWGVNERGQPSDGGFGFGKFTLSLVGRDSR